MPERLLRWRADGQLDFEELGFGNRERVGIGDLPISYRFTLAEFGGWPNDLYLHLDSVMDPISAETLERAYLRVDLNGTAIESFDLRDVSVLKEDIQLPEHLLQVENFLNLTFVYAPESGNCLGSPYAFKGQVLKTRGRPLLDMNPVESELYYREELAHLQLGEMNSLLAYPVFDRASTRIIAIIELINLPKFTIVN